MKSLDKHDVLLVEELMEPYKDILSDVLMSNDTHGEAQRQAWRDWAICELCEKLGLTEEQSLQIIKRIESSYTRK